MQSLICAAAWVSGLGADHAVAGVVSVAVAACAQTPALSRSWDRILKRTRAVVAAAGPLSESALLRTQGL